MKNKILKVLAGEIKNSIFAPWYSYKTKLFLCGASLNDKEKLRHRLDLIFKLVHPLKYHYEIIYPENIFDELLTGPAKENLLTLENMLVESVDIVIVIPESPGSFAELGAFVNNEKLREKIICLRDEKFKKDKSFLNYGPMQLIKNSKKGKLITIDYTLLPEIPQSFVPMEFLERSHIIYESKPIRTLLKAIKDIKKDNYFRKDKLNLLDAEHFLLPSIFLLEHAEIDDLINMFMAVSSYDFVGAKSATKAAVSVLGKKKLISLTSSGYKITKEGLDHFWQQGKSGLNRVVYNLNALDRIRLEVLTWKNRGKYPFSRKTFNLVRSQSVLN